MKQKGFTLVELLAVIVILAIIAVIATPLILNVIDNAKKGASESSALGYIEGIEKYIVLNEVTKEKDLNLLKNSGYTVENIKDYIEIKGDKATEGWVCIGDKKEITTAQLKINNYVVKYEDNKATVVDEEIGSMECSAGIPTSGPTKELAPEGATYKAVVYLDPTDLTKECNASNSVSTTETKEGCMKWYAYAEDDTNYTMILDHNTTAKIAYNSTISYDYSGSEFEPLEVKQQLEKDIELWDVSLSARLITADEIAKITGNTTFDLSSSTPFYFDTNTNSGSSTCTSGNQYAGIPADLSGCNYGWLYDRTSTWCESIGCLNNSDLDTSGYWTSTYIPNTGSVWGVNGNQLDRGYAYTVYVGVRPVITVSKTKIK